MTKAVMIVCLALFATSCANDGGHTERKLDSLENRIDTTLDRAADSLEVKAKDVRDKLRTKLRDVKDSLRTRDTL